MAGIISIISIISNLINETLGLRNYRPDVIFLSYLSD